MSRSRRSPRRGTSGRLYELTGPRALTFAEAVDEISRAAGREIRYSPISIEEHAAGAAKQGVPGEVIDLLSYLFSRGPRRPQLPRDRRRQRALGREPRDFADYARDAAATGVWSASAVPA